MQLDYGMILNRPGALESFQSGMAGVMQLQEAQAMSQARREQAEAQKMQAERQGMFQQAFGQAFQSGDRQQLASLMGEFPDQYEQIKGALGFQDEQRAATLGSLGVQLSTLASQDPNAAAQLIAQNADVLRQAGPGYEPEGLLQTLQQDPAALADRADKFSLLALGPEKYFEVMGGRAKIDAQMRGQDVQIRGQDIQQQEGQANRANARTLKQLTLADNALSRQVQSISQAAAAETNDLRRQELELKLQEKRGQLEQNRKELGDKQQTTIANMTEAARLATELVDDPNLGNAVGTVGTMIPTLSGQTQDVINKANRLQSLLTVDNLKLMSGVLTDRDIAFLTNVASGLNVVDGGIKGSEREVKKRLGEISTKMSEKLSKLQPLPTTPKPEKDKAATQEIQALTPEQQALVNRYSKRQ